MKKDQMKRAMKPKIEKASLSPTEMTVRALLHLYEKSDKIVETDDQQWENLNEYFTERLYKQPLFDIAESFSTHIHTLREVLKHLGIFDAGMWNQKIFPQEIHHMVNAYYRDCLAQTQIADLWDVTPPSIHYTLQEIKDAFNYFIKVLPKREAFTRKNLRIFFEGQEYHENFLRNIDDLSDTTLDGIFFTHSPT